MAEAHGITCLQMDELAGESHRRPAAATAARHFKSQIVPVPITSRKGTVMFDIDEHVKPDTSVETLAKMKPAFKKEGGPVTAGNAPASIHA